MLGCCSHRTPLAYVHVPGGHHLVDLCPEAWSLIANQNGALMAAMLDQALLGRVC